MTSAEAPSLYDWLKLAVDALIPLAVVSVGLLAKKFADDLERRRTIHEIASIWRIEVFKELSEKLNTLYCFFVYEGNWESISVEAATKCKRDCDRIVFVNSFLFSEDFHYEWSAFKSASFEEFTGEGQEFKFKSNADRHRKKENWKEQNSKRFVRPGSRIRRQDFKERYTKMYALAVRDLGIKPL